MTIAEIQQEILRLKKEKNMIQEKNNYYIVVFF